MSGVVVQGPELGSLRRITTADESNRCLLCSSLWVPEAVKHEVNSQGGGQTPFCRGADGRAVLRSSIREFLASEASIDNRRCHHSQTVLCSSLVLYVEEFDRG